MALDLGERLLPAFETPTGIPFHTINLRHGVSREVSQTRETCTAAAGTLLLELGLLSRLTGDARFEQGAPATAFITLSSPSSRAALLTRPAHPAARRAVGALWERRSKLDLIGSQIHTHRGRWLQTHTGIGAGVDSFYEYLLKAAILLRDDELLSWFTAAYAAVVDHTKWSQWNIEVAMDTGAPYSYRISALQAFWPSLQVLAGDVEAAKESFEPLYSLWRKYSALPEIFDVRRGRILEYAMDSPIRPEFAESTYHLYSATGEDRYLEVGREIIFALQNISRVSCGYASIADVTNNKRLDDRMDSFFLAETIKCAPRAPGRGSRFSLACSFRYLFLLFDASLAPEKRLSLFCPSDRPSQNANSTCIRPIQTLFSTEGHVFLLDSVDGQCESGPVGGR